MKHLKILVIIFLLGTILVPSSFAVHAKVAISDPMSKNQWYLDTLNISSVWDYSQGEDVVVAVLDSGFDTDHPDLVNQFWTNTDEIPGDGIDNDLNGYIDDVNGWDFVASDNTLEPSADINCFNADLCIEDAYNHGTIVSGIIAAEANNAFGIAGIAPKAKIMPLRVLTSLGDGQSDDVREAIDYAVMNGADVINMSFVGPTDDPFLTDAIQRAYNQGVVVVIAAGNEEVEGVPIDLTLNRRYPVCDDAVKGGEISIGVGSHDVNDVLSTFSNRGDCVDILAPGENIFSIIVKEDSLGFTDYYAGGYRGTSLSSPIVAATAALIKSVAPQMHVAVIMDYIKSNAKNIIALNPDNANDIGWGAIDVLSTLTSVIADSGTVNNVDSFQNTTVSTFVGDVVRVVGGDTLYYIGADLKRYVFTDTKSYLSWYNDFSNVKLVEPEVVSVFPLGGVVTYRPGVRLLKINSLPKVYAVSRGGVLRWITNSDVATALFGSDWQSLVTDVPDSFFINYTVGDDIASSDQYDVGMELLGARTINESKGL